METGILRYIPLQGWMVQLIDKPTFSIIRIHPSFDKTTMIYERGKEIEGELKDGFFLPTIN